MQKSATTYDTFTAPRRGFGSRDFAIVHPASQLWISIVLSENISDVRKHIGQSKISLYDAEEKSGRKAFSGLQASSWTSERASICAESNFILRADISRFFYTMYTHSLPWSILGKENVKKAIFSKKKSSSNNHWTHELDRALQHCQSRETFGIPVGPDTSRVLAEILLVGVENEPEFLGYLKDRPAARLVDDFFVGYRTESEAKSALSALASALREYNLQLNEDKTSITRSGDFFDERWKHEINKEVIRNHEPSLDFDTLDGIEKEVLGQRSEIRNLVNSALHLCSIYRTNTPAKWAARRISRANLAEDNLDVALEACLRLVRAYPTAIEHGATFILKHRERLQSAKNIEKVERWVRDTLHSPHSHSTDFEITWCLLVAGGLRLKISSSDFDSVTETPRGTVLAMLGLLHEHGISEVPLENFRWRHALHSTGANGRYWLPLYEGVLRNWTNDKKIKDEVSSHPLFSALLDSKITFLVDGFLESDADQETAPFALAGETAPREEQSMPPPEQQTSVEKFSLRDFLLGPDTDYEG